MTFAEFCDEIEREGLEIELWRRDAMDDFDVRSNSPHFADLPGGSLILFVASGYDDEEKWHSWADPPFNENVWEHALAIVYPEIGA